MIAWGGAAIWFDGPRSRAGAAILAGTFVIGSIAALLNVAPVGLGLAVFAAAFGAVLGWWLHLAPRNDRDWQPDVARTAHAEVNDEHVAIHNVRNFDHANAPPTARWEMREFDLRQLQGIDFFLCYWGPRKVAHTIVSFAFSGGDYLPISIEARKEKGETYSAVRSFFRRFELYYVVSDERDLIRLRTTVRGEQVYLYRLTTSVEHARALLLDYLQEVNRLGREPRWYNALTTNCTTTIRYHSQRVATSRPWDWRGLLNGYIDEMGYERGNLDRSLPFAELRARSDITERARAADGAADFSARIREGLPNPRVTRGTEPAR